MEPRCFFITKNRCSVPKLVLKDINGVNTGMFHMVKVLLDNVSKKILLFTFYSSISLTFLELAGRSYGRGVLEILPDDLSDLFLPKLPYNSGIDLANEIYRFKNK